METSQNWVICLILKNGDREFFTVTKEEYVNFRENYENIYFIEKQQPIIIRHAFGEIAFSRGQILSFEATLEGKDETIKRLNSIVAPDLHMALEVILKRFVKASNSQLADRFVELTRKVDALEKQIYSPKPQPTSPARSNMYCVAPPAEKTEAERLKDILTA